MSSGLRLAKPMTQLLVSDQIHYQILKHLPEASLQCLLKVFNIIWETGEFPPSWREATIIPIAKQGKDAKDPNNYGPIALTSCVCKTMERLHTSINPYMCRWNANYYHDLHTLIKMIGNYANAEHNIASTQKNLSSFHLMSIQSLRSSTLAFRRN